MQISDTCRASVLKKPCHLFPPREGTAMKAPAAEAQARRSRVQDVLMGCLLRAAFPCWPGADGLTVEDVVGSYPNAMTAGLVPGLEELLIRHPDLTDELRAFLSGADTPRPEEPAK